MATIKSYTDISQSKKLAEILPIESADYHYIAQGEKSYFYPYSLSSDAVKDYDEEIKYIPCWSLAALLDVIKEQGLVDLRFLQSTYNNKGNHLTNVWCCTFENLGTVSLDLYVDNLVDACYEMILKLHELKML